jgi:multidrug efflux pump subunit AcrA (membrane-fusion protein)
MTQHEKKTLVTGLALGLVLASVAYAATRLWHPERSAAQTQQSPIPKYETTSDQTTSQSAEHEQTQAGTSVSSIQLDQKEQRDIGVETVEVRRRNLQRALIAVAKVDEPETQLASISARIGGRIDKLNVDFTGQPVRRGQPVASIYSPEVFSTAEEYRLALENKRRLGAGAEPLAVSGADDLVIASRRRLELWGLTTQQLDEIASSAKPQIELPIYSTVSGIVTEPAMPAMGMGEMRAASDLTWRGTDYEGTIKVPTAGPWNVEVNASRNGQLLGSYHARLNAQ